MLDLKAFDRIFQQSLRIKSNQVSHTWTAEEMMRYDPQMPREVAEYHVKKMREASTDFDFITREYAGVDSVEELSKLSVAEAAARWLRARGPEWQREFAFREARKHSMPGCPAPDSIRAGVKAKIKTPPARILGSVTRDSVGYVLVAPAELGPDHHRARTADAYIPTPGVVTLHRRGNQWKIFPVEDMPHFTGVSGAMGFVVGCGFDSDYDDNSPVN
jgi:hypothetical protein